MESTSRMFDVLLGDVYGQKRTLAENGGKYMEMLDLS